VLAVLVVLFLKAPAPVTHCMVIRDSPTIVVLCKPLHKSQMSIENIGSLLRRSYFTEIQQQLTAKFMFWDHIPACLPMTSLLCCMQVICSCTSRQIFVPTRVINYELYSSCW